MRSWTADEVLALGVRTDLVTAASVLGIGRTVAHDLARRGKFPVPVLRLGRRYVVPVAGLLDLLRIDSPRDARTAPLTTSEAAADHPTDPREARYGEHPTALRRVADTG